MVNKVYQDPKVITKIHRSLPSISLHDFLEPKDYKKLVYRLKKCKWKKECVPDKFSFSIAKIPPKAAKILNHQEVLDILSKILKKEVDNIKLNAFRFAHKDYTILHDTLKSKPGTDIVFDCTGLWNEESGGNLVYKHKNGNTNSIPPNPNVLSIVHRNKGDLRFIQYINHYAKKKKRLILMGTIL